MKPQIGSVKTDRFIIDYFRFGVGKTPLVILPGMGLKSVISSADAVAEAFSAFAESHTVYLIERKREMTFGYHVEDMAEDTATAMRMLGIRGAHVFGASQGGMIAQVIAERHPDLVGRLVLGSSASRPNATTSETMTAWKRLALAGDIVALNRDMRERIYSPEYLETYRDAFTAIEADGTPDEMRRLAVLADACLFFDAYDALGKIRCPTLVIASKRDHVLSTAASVEIAEALGCECVLYDGYSHAVYDEAPDYRTHLKRFFEAEGN